MLSWKLSFCLRRKLIPIEDLERLPVKAIAFFIPLSFITSRRVKPQRHRFRVHTRIIMLLPHISHLGLTPQGLRTLSTRRQKDGQETILLSYLFLPKAVSDILQLVAIHTAIQALVSGRLVERTQMTDIRPQLDVVEMALVYVARESNAATIPCQIGRASCRERV